MDWTQREALWWTHPKLGGCYDAGSGWFWYPKTGASEVGPFQTLKETQDVAQKDSDDRAALKAALKAARRKDRAAISIPPCQNCGGPLRSNARSYYRDRVMAKRPSKLGPCCSTACYVAALVSHDGA